MPGLFSQKGYYWQTQCGFLKLDTELMRQIFDKPLHFSNLSCVSELLVILWAF